MDTCHFLVKQGASTVICQHSHCIGCMETYLDTPIIYGQGNMLFDMPSKSPTWHRGCLVHLTINHDGHIEVEMIPFNQSDKKLGAHHIPPNAESNWHSVFDKRSRHLTNP